MSFELYSNRGFETQLASNQGYTHLLEVCKGRSALDKFFDTGETDDIEGVLDELEKLMTVSSIPDHVQHTIKNLYQHAVGTTELRITH